MSPRFNAYSGILCGLLFISITTEAAAQLTKSSGGISISISKVLVAGQNVIIQLNAANNTNGWVYILDAQNDERQKAFLGSGPQLSWPKITGLELCGDTLARCLNPALSPESADINRYAYIEPGDFMSFTFNYETPSPANEADTISFGVDMIARYSPPDGRPQESGPMQAVRENFSYVPLNHH